MSQKMAARIAWTLCVLVVIATIGNVILNLTRYADTLDVVGTVIGFVGTPVFAITAALIISRQPRNTVGWLLMLEASLVFWVPLDTYFVHLPQAPTQPSLLTMIGLWIWGWAWLWYIFPVFFIPLFFPTGRLLSARWRWVVGLGLGLSLFFIFFATFSITFVTIDMPWTVPNPIGFLSHEAFPSGLWGFSLLAFGALCVASVVVRYRRAGQVERDQIKWLLYAVVLFAVIYGLNFITNPIGGLINEIVIKLRDLAVLLLPIAIAIAILRYRLYDINVVIRKTVQYGVVTAVLALIYFGTIILLQSLVGQATGEQSPIIIVLSTLLIAAMFNPLRQRVQTAVDRRFYRQKYDAQQVLAQFGETVRDEVEMSTLQAELLRVVQETLQPQQVGLWIVSEEKRQNLTVS